MGGNGDAGEMTTRNRKWLAAVAEIGSCVLCGKFGVQVAHRNEGRGMGQKSGDHLTAALCPECHHEIDNGRDLSQAERRERMNRAIVRTLDALVTSGKLVLR